MFELGLLCPEDRVEVLSEALEALDAVSVSVEDADAQTEHEEALFGEPNMPQDRSGWQRSRIAALFASEDGANQALRLLVAQDFFAGCHVVGVSKVPDQDWVRLTQSQFTPVAITPEFWIVPSWHEAPPQARQVIHLDPGLAFGTGTHPTTRMCLRWIARQRLGGQRVLDYGCGSGILAIAAAHFGAAQVDAVDIDPAAVMAAEANGVANGVQIRTGLPELATGRYHAVVANILAVPLKMLAPLLCAHVAPGGFLVLAGILERQAQELTTAYAPYTRLEVADAQDGWVLMTAAC
jgi:ribosomal protein L11 methyltransferase